MKRILSAILTLTMALSLTALPLFSANAEEDVTLTLDVKPSERNFVAPGGCPYHRREYEAVHRGKRRRSDLYCR